MKLSSKSLVALIVVYGFAIVGVVTGFIHLLFSLIGSPNIFISVLLAIFLCCGCVGLIYFKRDVFRRLINFSALRQLLEQNSQRKKILSMSEMPEHEFLHFIEGLLIDQGCNTRLISNTDNSSIELIAEKKGKKYGAMVVQSEKVVSENVVEVALEGSKTLDCCGTLVITNSFFTRDAKRLAEEQACKLVDASLLTKWSQIAIEDGSPA